MKGEIGMGTSQGRYSWSLVGEIHRRQGLGGVKIMVGEEGEDMCGRQTLEEDTMVQDGQHQKRRGILEETVSMRREAKEAQGKEAGGQEEGSGVIVG